MDPAFSLQEGSRKRDRDDTTNFSECIICQAKTSPYTSGKDILCNGTEKGLKTLRLRVAERQKYNDSECVDFYQQLNSIVSDCDQADFKWHRACYSQITNTTLIKRLQRRAELIKSDIDQQQESSDNSVRLSRHESGSMSWEKCMFCQTEKREKLRDVQTKDTSKKIIEMSQHDPVMHYRMSGVSDLIAAEGRYHLKCYTDFLRKHSSCGRAKHGDVCFSMVMNEMKDGMDKGNVYSIDTIWNRYCSLLSQVGEIPAAYHSRNFRDRICSHLAGSVEFVRPLDPKQPLLLFPAFSSGIAVQTLHRLTLDQAEMEDGSSLETTAVIDAESEILSWLYRVALKVRGDISVLSSHDLMVVSMKKMQRRLFLQVCTCSCI